MDQVDNTDIFGRSEGELEIAKVIAERGEETVKYANVLLDRQPLMSYTQEWTDLLMKEKKVSKEVLLNTGVVLRLGQEWMALSALVFKEVAENRLIHKLPHRSGPYFLGLANIRGRLRICVSLHKLLDIPAAQEKRESGDNFYEKMIVVERGTDFWVFPVDEVHGVFRFERGDLKNVPVTVAKSTANFLKGMLSWENKRIGVLDEDLLLNSLRRIAL